MKGSFQNCILKSSVKSDAYNKTCYSRMAINNGDEVNSNTEVDNVVSATFYFVFEKTNLEVFAESLERGNFVIKFPPSATF